MDEQTKETKEKEVKQPAKDTDEGSKYETTPVIERAREERERMEKATEAQRIENDRTEAIMAKQALGGTAEAGQPAEEKKEETPEEYRERVMRGEV